MPIKIAIADDHKALSDAIKYALAVHENLEVVKSFNNGDDLVNFLKSNEIDVVVTDIGMPGFSGLSLLNQIKKINIKPKVIFLSMHNEAPLIKEYLLNGLWAYVLKDSGIEELIKAIKSTEEKEPYNCQKTKTLLEKSKNISLNRNKLTKRELQIIKLLVKNLTAKEIAKEIFVEPSTVETHKKNIFKKLKLNSTVALVNHAHLYKLI